MTPLSDNIRTINDEWIRNENLPKRIYAQGFSDNIVPKESSISYDRDKQDVIYSNDDHFSIILPSDSEDIILKALIIELNKFLNQQKKELVLSLEYQLRDIRMRHILSNNVEELKELRFEIMKLKKQNPENYNIQKLTKEIQKSIENHGIVYHKLNNKHISTNNSQLKAKPIKWFWIIFLILVIILMITFLIKRF